MSTEDLSDHGESEWHPLCICGAFRGQPHSLNCKARAAVRQPKETVGLEITITRTARGVEVWQGNRTTGYLCPGECIEQVVALIYLGADGMRPGGYEMKTREEWGKGYAPKPKPSALSRMIAFGPTAIGAILALLLIALAYWAVAGSP